MLGICVINLLNTTKKFIGEKKNIKNKKFPGGKAEEKTNSTLVLDSIIS